ncbi:MAG: hypothetical protein IJA72_02460 [Clostridia bacterium]|nr:hypothetical protein [Clostridia bacterium]
MTITEYISRKAVIDCIDNVYYYDNGVFKDMIDKIQSENVRPVVHGG